MRSARFHKTGGNNKMAKEQSDNSLYPIAVLIDELRNDDVKVSFGSLKAPVSLQLALEVRNGTRNL